MARRAFINHDTVGGKSETIPQDQHDDPEYQKTAFPLHDHVLFVEKAYMEMFESLNALLLALGENLGVGFGFHVRLLGNDRLLSEALLRHRTVFEEALAFFPQRAQTAVRRLFEVLESSRAHVGRGAVLEGAHTCCCSCSSYRESRDSRVSRKRAAWNLARAIVAAFIRWLTLELRGGCSKGPTTHCLLFFRSHFLTGPFEINYHFFFILLTSQ